MLVSSGWLVYTGFMQDERWIGVAGWSGLYQVSDAGRVRRHTATGFRYLSGGVNDRGYVKVKFRDGPGRERIFAVHRLVLSSFVSQPVGKSCVNHIDGDKTNNRLANLEWVTHSENMEHAFRVGLRAPDSGVAGRRGELNHRAKLTTADVLAIRKRAGCGEPASDIASDFGVSRTAISNVIRGVSWSHACDGELADPAPAGQSD